MSSGSLPTLTFCDSKNEVSFLESPMNCPRLWAVLVRIRSEEKTQVFGDEQGRTLTLVS